MPEEGKRAFVYVDVGCRDVVPRGNYSLAFSSYHPADCTALEGKESGEESLGLERLERLRRERGCRLKDGEEEGDDDDDPPGTREGLIHITRSGRSSRKLLTNSILPDRLP